MTPRSLERSSDAVRTRNWRAISMSIAALVIAVFAAANAHLIYMAFASQPDCITHKQSGGSDPGRFGAARSSC